MPLTRAPKSATLVHTMTTESAEPEYTVNRLILGDNLEVLKTLDTESVGLIYLDPPFFSNRNDFVAT